MGHATRIMAMGMAMAFGFVSSAEAASALALTPRSSTNDAPYPVEPELPEDPVWLEPDDELDWLEGPADDGWSAPSEPTRAPASVPRPTVDPFGAKVVREPGEVERRGCGDDDACRKARRRGQAALGSGIVLALGGAAMLAAGLHGLATDESRGLGLTVASPHPIWIGATIAGLGRGAMRRAERSTQHEARVGVGAGGVTVRF